MHSIWMDTFPFQVFLGREAMLNTQQFLHVHTNSGFCTLVRAVRIYRFQLSPRHRLRAPQRMKVGMRMVSKAASEEETVQEWLTRKAGE